MMEKGKSVMVIISVQRLEAKSEILYRKMEAMALLVANFRT